jgi:hypothetical protein
MALDHSQTRHYKAETHTNAHGEDLGYPASARRASFRASQGKRAEAFVMPVSFTYARSLAALSPHPRALVLKPPTLLHR